MLNQIYDDGIPAKANGIGPSDILTTPARIAWELTRGEQACAEDCRVPKKYSTCACAGEACLKFQVDCKDGNCRVLAAAEKVDECSCQSKSDVYSCMPLGDPCEVATLDTGCATTGNTDINLSRDIVAAAAGQQMSMKNKMSEPIFPR